MTAEPLKPGPELVPRDPPQFRIKDIQSMFQDSEFAYGRCSLTLPVGVTLDEALKPEAWVNVSHRFVRKPDTNAPDRTGAIIEVRTQDHAFYAELYVRAVRGTMMDVEVLTDEDGNRRYFPLGPRKPVSDAMPYEIRWNVGKRGFDVIRKSDRVVVEGGEKFPTRELALRWLDEVAGIKAAA